MAEETAHSLLDELLEALRHTETPTLEVEARAAAWLAKHPVDDNELPHLRNLKRAVEEELRYPVPQRDWSNLREALGDLPELPTKSRA